MYVVYSNELLLHVPAMHWLLELDDPPVGVARRRHSVPSQHCAAIASPWMGSWVAVALVTQTPEPSVRPPLSAQTPSLGKGDGGDGLGGVGEEADGDGAGGGGDQLSSYVSVVNQSAVLVVGIFPEHAQVSPFVVQLVLVREPATLPLHVSAVVAVSKPWWVNDACTGSLRLLMLLPWIHWRPTGHAARYRSSDRWPS